MRIVGGVWAGTDLMSPGRRVRATSEKLRARWMDVLDAHLEGAHVLDLFAGSGALGLEALSRGALSCDFVESGAVALHALKANVAARHLRAPDPRHPPTVRRKAARIFKRDAIPFVRGLDQGRYDLAFADPPYGSRKLDLVVEQWKVVRFSRVLAVEHAREHELPEGSRRHEIDGCLVTIYGLPRRSRSPAGRKGPPH